MFAVTGATDVRDPKTPADKAKEVAMAIKEDLEQIQGTGTNILVSGRKRSASDADPPADDSVEQAITDSDIEVLRRYTAKGRTWEQIVGSSNVVEIRISGAGTSTKPVKAAYVDGEIGGLDSPLAATNKVAGAETQQGM